MEPVLPELRLAGSAAPRVIIIAGLNGAGKTTFAREFLPNEAVCPVFVNADLIAAGLAPFARETAALQTGRVMLQQLALHTAARVSFAFETTLSGRGYLRLIDQWQVMGYRVKLIFLQLASPDEAIARVSLHVSQGGHHIPDEVVRRHFLAGRENFHRLCARACRPGPFMTTQATSPCCWIGAKSHEQTTDREGPRSGSAAVSGGPAACGAPGA